MDTKGGKWRGWGGGGVMNWEIGFDMYTLMCIKWMTNKNLLYKKINKIKFRHSNKIILIGRSIYIKKILHFLTKYYYWINRLCHFNSKCLLDNDWSSQMWFDSSFLYL